MSPPAPPLSVSDPPPPLNVLATTAVPAAMVSLPSPPTTFSMSGVPPDTKPTLSFWHDDGQLTPSLRTLSSVTATGSSRPA